MFITSINHSFKSVVSADEDCLEEINLMKSSLSEYFKDANKSMVFFESYRKKTSSNRNHLKIECFPIDSELLGETKMYFKKAILECEGEWDMNKKLIELNGRSIVKALPNVLPYFCVTFGPSNDGYAHVIEDEESFPVHFGHEVIGGVLDLEPRQWKKPRNVNYDRQFEEATKFKSKWATFNPFRAS
jgi:hypothetical protein